MIDQHDAGSGGFELPDNRYERYVSFLVDLGWIYFGKVNELTISGAGTVYFTSIRPQQEGAWRIGELYPD
jgi:hypothetical protein